ncbi:MAG: ABC transporter substrate-binding protein [Candidatus Tectimicrobiota bacterium]|nr:MAG: ABC transporter substrate-binding protein [Candidatus Tectomicrobia bacterium]
MRNKLVLPLLGLLLGALIVGLAYQAWQAAPAAAQTRPIVWKMQTSFAAGTPLDLSFSALAKKVEEMSGGRLKWEVLPAGAIVAAFEVLDAVNRGILDGGGTVPAYWVGKSRAISLFGTGPSYGLNANELLAWEWYGGGQQLYNDLLQKKLGFNVVAFHFGPMPTQPLGWFRKPVRSLADIKGIKYRTVGLAADMYKAMGLAVVTLPGGEIIPALERGVIDAAEFNNPTDDKRLGFADVASYYVTRSFHQPVEYLEVIINKSKWDALPADLQAVVRYAVMAESADFTWRLLHSNAQDFDELVNQRGVKVIWAPEDILRAQLDAWDQVVARYSAEDPEFARIAGEIRKWASKVVPLRVSIQVDNRIAYEKYWKKEWEGKIFETFP